METPTPKERLLDVLRERAGIGRPPARYLPGRYDERGHRRDHGTDGPYPSRGSRGCRTSWRKSPSMSRNRRASRTSAFPFCMTVEAEVAGSDINLGSLSCEPKISKEAYPSGLRRRIPGCSRPRRSGRIPVVLGAIEKLSQVPSPRPCHRDPHRPHKPCRFPRRPRHLLQGAAI